MSVNNLKLRFVVDVMLVSVGITNLVDVDLLKALSSPPHEEGKQYFSAPDFQSLNPILREVANSACVRGSSKWDIPSMTNADKTIS